MVKQEGPLVTVVMPIYNMERFLDESVQSVLNQTYSNLEVLLIDDCSTDNSRNIAEKYVAQDRRVRMIKFSENCGVAKVRNRGIAEARGEYIALLDSDDVWMPDKIELQVNLLRDSGASIAYCSYDLTDEDGKVIKKPFLVPSQTDYRHMLVKSVISCSTAVISTELLRAHPFVGDQYHEDYVLWMQLLSDESVKAVGAVKVLAHYRQVRGSRSNNKGNAARNRWKVYRKSLGLSLGSSLWAFFQYSVQGVLKYYL